MPVSPDYEKWATQHALLEMEAVQVLEFVHETWGSHWVTGYGEPFQGVTEDARAFTAQPVAFQVEMPKAGQSTQQEMILRMDALTGFVMNSIRQMTDAQREIPIVLIWRLYLDGKPNAPCVDPLSFEILSITGQRLAVEIRAAATVLPNVAAGTRYTLNRFPTLAYL